MNISHNIQIKTIFANLVFLLFITCIVCSGWLQNYVHETFSYIDELFAILICGCAIFEFCVKKIKLNQYEISFVVLCFLLIIIGFLGNLFSEYQANKFAMLTDCLSWLKLFVVFPCLNILINPENGKKYYTIALHYTKFFIIVMFMLVIVNLVHLLPIDDKYDRFGLPAFAFGSHPTFTAAITCGFLSLLLFDYKKNFFWIVLSCIITIATLRIKAIVYICIVAMMILFVGNKKSLEWKHLVMAFLMCILIASNQISYYFFDSEMSRAAAFLASLKIAMSFFPIGSGFATFGTLASGQYYSEAYYIYGLSDKFGFSPEAYSFVGDGGWATVIGQFGLIGILLIICMIFLMYKSIIAYKPLTLNQLPVLSIFSYLLIASSSEIAFCSNYSLILACCFTLIVNKYKYEKINSQAMNFHKA
ncbi:MAG: hypothetical protein LBT05_00315 [Planctomycetaceae bacterium]|jgi:hypothetical protein|nr:hypothetical protein [Planctomycetaceae bacterium]